MASSMTEIEKKALALVNEVIAERGFGPHRYYRRENGVVAEGLCRAIERHEAYKQRVSEFARRVRQFVSPGGCATLKQEGFQFDEFIIPKPVDPLVEALNDMKDGRAGPTTESYAACLRTALAARGGRIVFDQSEGGAA